MRRQDVRTYEDYYEWLDEELDRIYGMGIQPENFPIRMSALRGEIVWPPRNWPTKEEGLTKEEFSKTMRDYVKDILEVS